MPLNAMGDVFFQAAWIVPFHTEQLLPELNADG